MTSIHISDVRTFRTCRRRWEWSSAMGRNLEPTVPYIPFFTGRAIHHCLEMYYGPQHIPLDKSLDKFLTDEKTEIDKVGALWPQEEITFAEQIEMMRGLLGHYKLWVEHDHKMYSDENLEFISLETEFDVPMLTPGGRASKKMRLGGRFDGVVKHTPTGEYWIWECKTTRSVQELVNSLANDEQCGVYVHAASKVLGVPIKGVLYNIIRKKVPAVPHLLQNGMLSQSTRADCTAFFYVWCIHQLYPDWSADTIQGFYGPFLEILKEKEQAFFLRFPVYRTDYEIQDLMKNIYYTGCEMVRLTTVKRYPAPGWLNCTMCHFRSPCLAMNAGSDYEVLLAAEYQQRESTYSVRSEGSSTDERT